MNFCIFSSQYLPHLGGVERFTNYIALELIRRGHNVSIVTSAMTGQKDVELTDDGICVYRFPSVGFMDGRFPVLKYGSLSKMKRMLAEKHFDAVIVNTRFYPLSLFGLRFASQGGIRSIVIDHGSSHISFGSPIISRIGELYEHCITDIEKKYCKDFYGVSQESCDWLHHFGIKAKGILYNAINEDELIRLMNSSVDHYRKDYAIDNGTKVIVFTGRLIREKGVISLIEATKRLSANYQIHVFIAGDGELMDKLKENCPCNITLLGKISFNEVACLLKESDFFCLPSSYPEGFCTSVLEAIAAHKLVVATNIPGVNPIIKDNVSGFIISENSADAVTEALLRAFTAIDIDKITDSAYKSYLKCGCNFEKTAESILNIFGA